MPENTQETVFSENNKPRRLFKAMRICAYITALLLFLLAFLPAGLRLGTRYWLNKQPHLEAEIDNIDLNLFRGTCALEGLRLKHKGKPSLTTERLIIGVKYLPLWNKHAFIDYVELDGLHLVLKQVIAEGKVHGGLRIGGIMLPNTPAEQEGEKATPAPDTATPWNFGWNRIVIANSEIIWRQPDWSADLIIEQACLSNVASWKPEGYSDLQLQLRVNDAPLAMTMKSQPFASQPTAKGHISLKGFALDKLAPVLATVGIHDVAGMFSCDLKHEVKLGPGDAIGLEVSGSLNLAQGALTTAQIHIAKAGLNWSGTSAITTVPQGTTRITLEGDLQFPVLDGEDIRSGAALQQQGLSWQGSANTKLEGENSPEIEIKGTLATDALTLADRKRGRLLTSWSGFKADSITFNGQQLQLEKLVIDNLVALRPSTNPVDTEPALARCGSINLTGIEVELPGEETGAKVALNTLSLDALGVELIRYPSGHTNIAQWSGAEVESTTSEADAAAADTGAGVESGKNVPAPAWSLSRLKIGGSSYMRVTDATVTPEVTLHLNNLKLNLHQLDSSAVHTRNPFYLKTMLGRFAMLEAEGTMSLLRQPPAGSLQTSLQGFPLYTISPYVENAIGSRIEKGELDFDASANIENKQLKLESQATLRSLTFGPMAEEQQEQISRNLGMPISLALALLRDKNGDIHLDIPVSGDLSSPDIAIGPVIRKALLGAIQETVKLALKPLGILSGAGKLIGIGADLKLPPVLFAPAQTNPTDAGAELKPLGELLATRPQLRVVLQAPLTLADSESLHTQLAETGQKESLAKNKQDKTQQRAEEKGLSREQFQILATSLLQKRLNITKQGLLDISGVEPQQIIISQPDLTLTTDKPRVEIHF